jgi:hypothetical protein
MQLRYLLSLLVLLAGGNGVIQCEDPANPLATPETAASTVQPAPTKADDQECPNPQCSIKLDKLPKIRRQPGKCYPCVYSRWASCSVCGDNRNILVYEN